MLMLRNTPLIDRYASPEALARVASAPLVVCEMIFVLTEGDRRHIGMLRDGRGDSETWAERYAIIWVARQFTHHSFPEIGRALASDHSSVIRGYNRAKMLYRTNNEFRAIAATLIKALPTRHRVQKAAQQALQRLGR
jgi:hypothetical protein